MSITLNLVIYQRENGVLVEENLKTVRCEEIPGPLLEQITNSFPMKEAKVYFDGELAESFEIQHFESSDIEGIIKMLHELFRVLIKYEDGELNQGGDEPSGQRVIAKNIVASISPEQSQLTPVEQAIVRFRILIGIIELFSYKQNNLSNEVGALIKLG